MIMHQAYNSKKLACFMFKPADLFAAAAFLVCFYNSNPLSLGFTDVSKPLSHDGGASKLTKPYGVVLYSCRFPKGLQ